MRVNFIFGAELDGAIASCSSIPIADNGGLVAKGEGTAAPYENDALGAGRLNPLRPGTPGVIGGGLVAEVGGTGRGGVPLLNSAQRGHLRLVSVSITM